MLTSLAVKNYALIDELQLQFGKKLNIITGETGAGKSILLGALGLLLGQRADSNSLLDKTKKCIVEGEFDSKNKFIDEFFSSNELDPESRIIIRSEISKEGKSRAFINDTPVSISQLKELGNLLVDIHSQHETLLLNKSGFQLSVVDSFAGIDNELTDYQQKFSDYKKLLVQLNELKADEAKSKSEQDYITFQFNELEEAALETGETKEKLDEELKTLSHSEEIRVGLSKLDEVISGGETDLLTSISSAVQIVQQLSKYNSKLEVVAERLKSVQIELKDISQESTSISDEVQLDPQRLEIVNDRLNILNRLEQKHRVNSTQELIALKNDFEKKLENINSMDERIEGLEKEKEKLFATLLMKADKISASRAKVIPGIETKVKKMLSELGMPNAILKIEQESLGNNELNLTGKDSIRFLFSANKGVAYSEISKVASGGELSRLMLCLKAIVAKLIDLPTVVFDEIDTGVSGETAYKIGNVMNDLSSSLQLLAITHLPQIASRGDVHFFVYKEVIGKRTFTKVSRLSAEERIVEVARMLSGDKPTAIAMQNAKELLGN
ncbi:MAG: DNA repair protein RecN [Bacteroidetes bacterium]|nr:DNA repair protein RecN [Bacteroidota bacterium]